MLSPKYPGVYERAGMLSTNGRCKTFDARANGYARGEGIGAVVLRGSQLAVHGSSLLCSRVRADGKSASLTAPNGTAQARMISAALAAAGDVQLGLVEAHGTGTPLGHPTEAGGLQRSLGAAGPCPGRAPAKVGHPAAAAGRRGLRGPAPSAPPLQSMRKCLG